MTAPTEEIAKRYGLESIPESVKRLGALVNSQNVSTEQAAKVIAQDKALVARLLKGNKTTGSPRSRIRLIARAWGLSCSWPCMIP
jgi:hypothetical protein